MKNFFKITMLFAILLIASCAGGPCTTCSNEPTNKFIVSAIELDSVQKAEVTNVQGGYSFTIPASDFSVGDTLVLVHQDNSSSLNYE